MTERSPKPAAPEPWVLRIARVVDHVQGHLDEELAPAELADLAGFSLHHFHRIFRGVTGESVMGFVRRLRLERAAMRLRYGVAPVTEVALASGYQSHEAFTRAFRAQFGMSPSAYRRTGPEVAARFEMHVRDIPPRRALGIRWVGPYEGCEAAWERLLPWAGAAGLDDEAPRSIGLVYDDPEVTDAARLRYDACLVLDDETFAALGPPPPGVVERRVPGGRYAVATHHGPFEDIYETYVALLGAWLPGRSVELADEPVVEVYLRSPVDTPPDDLLTEVQVRLA